MKRDRSIHVIRKMLGHHREVLLLGIIDYLDKRSQINGM